MRKERGICVNMDGMQWQERKAPAEVNLSMPFLFGLAIGP